MVWSRWWDTRLKWPDRCCLPSVLSVQLQTQHSWSHLRPFMRVAQPDPTPRPPPIKDTVYLPQMFLIGNLSLTITYHTTCSNVLWCYKGGKETICKESKGFQDVSWCLTIAKYKIIDSFRAGNDVRNHLHCAPYFSDEESRLWASYTSEILFIKVSRTHMVTMELWKVSGIEGAAVLWCDWRGMYPNMERPRAPEIRDRLAARLHRRALEEEQRHGLP